MSWNTHIPKFRRFVLQNFPFIEEDFDALTDYELICKVIEFLNKVITSQNEVVAEVGRFETNITNNFNRLEGLFNDLKTFVDNYFDNLDVQEEINNKLDEMTENGTLEEIIGQYLNPSVVWGYDTVSDMKSDTTLTAGGFAKTLGFYSKDDVGGAYYKIRSKTNDDTIDEHILIQLNDNSLVAELVPEQKMNILQFGIVKNTDSDNAGNIQKAVNYCKNITFENGTYITNSTIRLNAGQTIDLNGGTIDCSVLNVFFNFLNTDDYTGYNGKGRITIKNGTLTACISFFHADYLEFSNLTFNECKNDHCIQLAGCRNVEISECVFNGSSSRIAVTNYFSAINLDPCDNGAFPLAPWDLPNTWDLTPCANFHIHDNFFNMVEGTPSGLDFVRGLDVHYAPTLSNRHTHMDFYSNTIIGCGRSSNYIAQWDYVNIHDNTFFSPRIGLTVFSCGDISIFSNVFNYNGNGASGEPIELVNRSTNLAVFSNSNNYVINNSTPPTVYKQETYDDAPFTITVGRMDYVMSGASQQTPNAEFALSVPYNTISNLLMYVGKGSDLYTFELNSFYGRKFQEGDVFKFQSPLGNITFTFIADDKIRYENTDTDPATNQLRNVLIGNKLLF